MVAAAELPGALDGDDVLGLLDHTDDREVAARVQADPALLGLRDIAADGAEPDLVLDLQQRVRQPADVDRVGLQDVEGDPLRALGPDAGQPAQFVDQVLNHALVHVAPSLGLDRWHPRGVLRCHHPTNRTPGAPPDARLPH